MICGISSLPLPPSIQSALSSHFLTAGNPFHVSRRGGSIILDDSRPARGKGGGSHGMFVPEASRHWGRTSRYVP